MHSNHLSCRYDSGIPDEINSSFSVSLEGTNLRVSRLEVGTLEFLTLLVGDLVAEGVLSQKEVGADLMRKNFEIRKSLDLRLSKKSPPRAAVGTGLRPGSWERESTISWDRKTVHELEPQDSALRCWVLQQAGLTDQLCEEDFPAKFERAWQKLFLSPGQRARARKLKQLPEPIPVTSREEYQRQARESELETERSRVSLTLENCKGSQGAPIDIVTPEWRTPKIPMFFEGRSNGKAVFSLDIRLSRAGQLRPFWGLLPKALPALVDRPQYRRVWVSPRIHDLAVTRFHRVGEYHEMQTETGAIRFFGLRVDGKDATIWCPMPSEKPAAFVQPEVLFISPTKLELRGSPFGTRYKALTSWLVSHGFRLGETRVLRTAKVQGRNGEFDSPRDVVETWVAKSPLKVLPGMFGHAGRLNLLSRISPEITLHRQTVSWDYEILEIRSARSRLQKLRKEMPDDQVIAPMSLVPMMAIGNRKAAAMTVKVKAGEYRSNDYQVTLIESGHEERIIDEVRAVEILASGADTSAIVNRLSNRFELLSTVREYRNLPCMLEGEARVCVGIRTIMTPTQRVVYPAIKVDASGKLHRRHVLALLGD